MRRPLTAAFWGQQLGGGRSVLGDAPSPSPPPSPSGTGLVRESQQLEQSPQGTASFYWERSKERSGRTWPGGPVGSEDAATAGGAPLPGRASWRGRFTPCLSMGLWPRAGRCRRRSGTTYSESGGRGGFATKRVLLSFGKATLSRAQGVELITANYLAYNTWAPACRSGREPQMSNQEKAPRFHPPHHPASCEFSF